MKMLARVLIIQNANLLVCDESTNQEVLVHTPCSRHFNVGDKVFIKYNGIMTLSIPPQITAICISRMSKCDY